MEIPVLHIRGTCSVVVEEETTDNPHLRREMVMLELVVLVVVVVPPKATAHQLVDPLQIQTKDRAVVAVDTLVAAVVVG